MATCGGDMLGNWDAAALGALRWHYDTAYRIDLAGGTWNATYLGAPAEVLTADTPDELRKLIRADYIRRTRPRMAARSLQT